MISESIYKLRHSAAHLMAAAVKNLFDNVKLDIGPPTEEGFYYDFDMEHRLSPDDLSKIEEEMVSLAKRGDPFTCEEKSRDTARQWLDTNKELYKVERLQDIPDNEKITFFRCGDFIDLCRGPHVENTSEIKNFKLLSIAGSYYRGNENNPMLQRIYGTAFETHKELKNYLRSIEEAKKRDHRKLGTELDLFCIDEEVGAGLIMWKPKGARIRSIIEDFWKDAHFEHGYEQLYTPHIGLGNLWNTSGHLDFYNDAMYSPMKVDDRDYFIKPMNCPFHIKIYQTQNRSYRELPLRWAELGTVYRYEKSGVLHGLLRVRGFTQDDAHIFCTLDQINDELVKALQFSLFMWKSFGFSDVKAYLSTQPPKSVGEKEDWDRATDALKLAIKSANLESEIDQGGGAFYGPKIDLKVKDAIGREWQTTTIQFDFNLPHRFNLFYIGEDGKKHRPYMIHRALLGSIERFFGILIEHYAGAFPLWLSPLQARVIPITNGQHDRAVSITNILKKNKIRTDCDIRNESLGSRIRKARNERIPYILVLGERELENGEVSVRTRGDGQIGNMSIDHVVSKIKEEIKKKQ